MTNNEKDIKFRNLQTKNVQWVDRSTTIYLKPKCNGNDKMTK